jgi:hypothetical protein
MIWMDRSKRSTTQQETAFHAREFSERSGSSRRRDAHDLTRLNGFDMRQASGHERQEVFQAVQLREENNNCNLSGRLGFAGIRYLDPQ